MSAVKEVKRFVTWKLTEDTSSSLTYGTAVPHENQLITVTDTPEVATGELWADGKKVEDAVEILGGTLAVGVSSLTSEDRVTFYGETIKNGTNVGNENDMGSYVAAAYMTVRGDGLVNLYKKPKVRFMPQAETFNTKQKGNITYATTNLNGNYVSTINNGDHSYRVFGVDPVADATFIEAFFTDALKYDNPAGA